jgi:hypothetical protein
MPDDWTVLDHLLEGREQLQRELAHLRREVERIDDAIAGLDVVIGRVGGDSRSDAARRQSTAPLRSGRAATRSASVHAGEGEAPKSIRVHILDMLAAQDRDFGLAEIIDNIHAAGIQAHDDAVRSITIKLMKDGSVERVGRGQYRLARPGDRSSAAAPASFEAAPVEAASVEAAPVDAEPTDAEPVDATQESAVDTGSQQEPSAESPDGSDSYTPPLNLGQAWE